MPELAVKSSAAAVSPPAIEVAKFTLSEACASPVRVTVNVMPKPSVLLALEMLKLGAVSLSLIVPVAVAVVILAPPVALLIVAVKVSLPS